MSPRVPRPGFQSSRRSSGADPEERGQGERLPDDAVEPHGLGSEEAAGVQLQPHERGDDGDRERVHGSDHRAGEHASAERRAGTASRRPARSEEHPYREARPRQEREGDPAGRSARTGHVDRDLVERELVEPTELERGREREPAAEDVDRYRNDLCRDRGRQERQQPALDRGRPRGPQPRTAFRDVRLRGNRRRGGDHPAAACTSSATSVGVRPTRTPAASSASAFAIAVPMEPVTMAPACPIRLPGGASNPAM